MPLQTPDSKQPEEKKKDTLEDVAAKVSDNARWMNARAAEANDAQKSPHFIYKLDKKGLYSTVNDLMYRAELKSCQAELKKLRSEIDNQYDALLRGDKFDKAKLDTAFANASNALSQAKKTNPANATKFDESLGVLKDLQNKKLQNELETLNVKLEEQKLTQRSKELTQRTAIAEDKKRQETYAFKIRTFLGMQETEKLLWERTDAKEPVDPTSAGITAVGYTKVQPDGVYSRDTDVDIIKKDGVIRAIPTKGVFGASNETIYSEMLNFAASACGSSSVVFDFDDPKDVQLDHIDIVLKLAREKGMMVSLGKNIEQVLMNKGKKVRDEAHAKLKDLNDYVAQKFPDKVTVRAKTAANEGDVFEMKALQAGLDRSTMGADSKVNLDHEMTLLPAQVDITNPQYVAQLQKVVSLILEHQDALMKATAALDVKLDAIEQAIVNEPNNPMLKERYEELVKLKDALFMKQNEYDGNKVAYDPRLQELERYLNTEKAKPNLSPKDKERLEKSLSKVTEGVADSGRLANGGDLATAITDFNTKISGRDFAAFKTDVQAKPRPSPI